MPSKTDERRNVCLNRRARFEYEILDVYEAGLLLQGSEVKSLRAGKANLDDAWVGFEPSGHMALFGAHIAPFPQANRYNHEPTRPRPLLLNAEEIVKLRQAIKEKGLTLVPLQLYFKGGWCKLEFAMGRGKKLHDKRASIREAEQKREVARAIRGGV